MLSTRPLRSLRIVPLALMLGAGVGIWLAPGTARATAIAADLELDTPTNLDIDSAPAFAVRLGWQVHLPAIAITPEVGYHHVAFGDDVTLNRGFAGVRLAIGEVFRIGAYAHVGVANVDYHFGQYEDVTDATYDIGGFLDFTLLPLLDIGVHAGYGHVKGGDDGAALQWVPVGAHVALIF